MSFDNYRARSPRKPYVSKEKPFVPPVSKLTPEDAAKRKAEIFKSKPKGDRVQKLIAAAGLCSRREAEEWIAQGRVQVNGHVIKLGDQATPSDKVTVNGAPLPSQKARYILLHKPEGYVTTLRDIYGNKTVMELVDIEERVYPIGRLDKDTRGALLLTNDGEFANRIMHPRYEVEKTYLATLDKPFERKLVPVYARGVRIKEGLVRATVHTIGKNKISVTLHQGFNHVVKRILKLNGYWVRDLVRTGIGPLKLDIPEGAYRELTEKEKDTLMRAGDHAKAPVRRH